MARNYDYNGDPCGEYGAAVRDVEQLRERLLRLRLTDEEREALEASFEHWQSNADCSLGNDTDRKYASALRGFIDLHQ